MIHHKYHAKVSPVAKYNAITSRLPDMLVDNGQRGYSPSLSDCIVSIADTAAYCQEHLP